MDLPVLDQEQDSCSIAVRCRPLGWQRSGPPTPLLEPLQGIVGCHLCSGTTVPGNDLGLEGDAGKGITGTLWTASIAADVTEDSTETSLPLPTSRRRRR